MYKLYKILYHPHLFRYITLLPDNISLCNGNNWKGTRLRNLYNFSLFSRHNSWLIGWYLNRSLLYKFNTPCWIWRFNSSPLWRVCRYFLRHKIRPNKFCIFGFHRRKCNFRRYLTPRPGDKHYRINTGFHGIPCKLSRMYRSDNPRFHLGCLYTRFRIRKTRFCILCIYLRLCGFSGNFYRSDFFPRKYCFRGPKSTKYCINYTNTWKGSKRRYLTDKKYNFRSRVISNNMNLSKTNFWSRKTRICTTCKRATDF